MNYLYSAYFATWALHFAYLGVIAAKLMTSSRLERSITESLRKRRSSER